MHVVIVGAGIIGASIAWHLTQAGVTVTVVDAGMPGQGASGRSFGWINASFFLDDDHHRFRVAGMQTWARMKTELALPSVNWPGALWWEETGRAFDMTLAGLTGLGYAVQVVDKAQFAALEPGVADPPERALRFGGEGAVDLPAAIAVLLAPARVLSGVAVSAIASDDQKVTGVVTAEGVLAADAVVLAAGIGAPDLAVPLGVTLPLVDRPGAVARTAPVPPLLSHILVAPGQELRQEPGGRLLAPTSPAHQGDRSARLAQLPTELADGALVRVQRLLGQPALAWDHVSLAMRPVPRDDLPIIGPAGPDGLYVAVMHSGATLGAVTGALAAAEIASDAPQAMLAPYRPNRFQP